MRIIKTICVIMLGCLFLAGCSYKNEILDYQARCVVEVMNDDDPEAFRDLFLNASEASDEDYMNVYDGFKASWVPVDPDEIKLVRFNINMKMATGSDTVKTYDGVYELPVDGENNALIITYVESGEGKGLTSVYLGTYTKEIDPMSIASVATLVVYLAAVIVTIVDIVRKKPGYYGVFIAVAFVCLRFKLFDIRILIPVGSIFYWCIRGSLLKKKASKTEDFE